MYRISTHGFLNGHGVLFAENSERIMSQQLIDSAAYLPTIDSIGKCITDALNEHVRPSEINFENLFIVNVNGKKHCFSFDYLPDLMRVKKSLIDFLEQCKENETANFALRNGTASE